MRKTSKRRTETVGVVGLGLMGRGIATCLVANGFSVVAFDRVTGKGEQCCEHIDKALTELVSRGLLKRTATRDWRARFQSASSIDELGGCRFVIEAVKEDLPLKKRIFSRLEEALPPDAIIASNTSSIPIGQLQQGCRSPERIIGMHWGEPAQITRYLEIIPGKKTSPETIQRTKELGALCGKEPSVLQFDIRGFVSNRMMYAMMREACHLLEAGVADIETIDRSFRNDIGWWATLAGPFRWMDLTGIPAYAAVMEDLLPKLSNSKKVSETMKDAVRRGAQGISNRKGFYQYTAKDAAKWERAWVEFTYDIRKLVDKYERLVKL